MLLHFSELMCEITFTCIIQKILNQNTMNKLNFFGVGPKIGKVLLPWLAVTILLSYTTNLFAFTTENTRVLKIVGTVLMIFGLIFYFSTVRLLLKGLKETRLVTNGAFSLCQNPLYAAILLFIIPALSLLLNSWIILSSTLVGYFMFKLYIKGEYQELEKYFGEEYLKYKSETPEFLPFPIKKWAK
jgi:protein-S-isoprenylcysteine O-methyltransferase Ste14